MTSVAVLATLDSKHEAAQFVCAALREAGVDALAVRSVAAAARSMTSPM